MVHYRTTPAERASRSKVRGTGNIRVRFTLRSANAKTGPIPVTMTERGSCPDACAFKGHGCYGEEHNWIRHYWSEVPRDGLSWAVFCETIAGLPRGQVWRHNEVGDLPGPGDRLDLPRLARLVDANARAGARAICFTHKPLRLPGEREAIRDANARGFTINLSADSLADVDRMVALQVGPVSVVLPSDAPRHATRTPAGHQVVVCPAQTHGLSCARCRMCAVSTRKSVIGFLAHGNQERLVTSLVRGKRSLMAEVRDGDAEGLETGVDAGLEGGPQSSSQGAPASRADSGRDAVSSGGTSSGGPDLFLRFDAIQEPSSSALAPLRKRFVYQGPPAGVARLAGGAGLPRAPAPPPEWDGDSAVSTVPPGAVSVSPDAVHEPAGGAGVRLQPSAGDAPLPGALDRVAVPPGALPRLRPAPTGHGDLGAAASRRWVDRGDAPVSPLSPLGRAISGALQGAILRAPSSRDPKPGPGARDGGLGSIEGDGQ